jgi:PAS domain S-box-containing protein
MDRAGDRADRQIAAGADPAWGPTPPPPAVVRRPHEAFVANWRAGARPAATMGFDGYFEWMNEPMRRWWGWSSETLTGVDWWEFVHPEHQDDMVAVVEAVMNHEQFVDVPCRALRADGRYGWLLLDLVADPGTERMFGMVREQAGAAQADPVRVGEWSLSPTTAELTLTPAAARIVGLPAGTGLDLNDLLARLERRDRYRLRAELVAGWADRESVARDLRLDDDGPGPGTPVRFVAGRPGRVQPGGRVPSWHGFLRQTGV